jgi:hypothetical protein
MDSSFTVFAVGIEIALYKVASINVLIQVCQDEFELFFCQKNVHLLSVSLQSKHFSLVGYRCVICQMEYKRGDRQITLPCKHIYHAGCGTRWLSINKVSCWDFTRNSRTSFVVFLHVLQKADDHLSIRPAPSATQRFLVMHQNIKV